MKAISLYGPPGTGKTRKLVDMVNKAAKVGTCAILSYTKAAAQEIASRLPPNLPFPIRTGTIHSFCFGLAELKRGSIVDDGKLKDFSKEIGIPISATSVVMGYEYEKQEVGNSYLRIISLARARYHQYEHAYETSDRPGDPAEFLKFARGYRDWKRTYGFSDFDDMLELGTGAGARIADFVFVDEAQDLSVAQWNAVQGWASLARAAVIAGDDDQAIHEWAGANPHGMAAFSEANDAEARVLSVSHRLPVSVYELSKRIVGQIEHRVEKEYVPASDRPGLVTRAGTLTGSLLRPGTMVLARNHMLFNDLTESLNAAGIPYKGGGGPLYRGLSELALRFHENHTGRLSMGAIYKARNLYGHKAAEAIEKGGPIPTDPLKFYDRDGHNEYLATLIQKFGSITAAREQALELSTIHSSKGREADHVVLLNAMTDRTSETYARNRDSELRVFYVGATRARESLTIVDGDNAIEVFDQ